MEQIVASLLAEVDDGATKAALADATLQIRRVRDGVNGEAARRGQLEKHLNDIKMKGQAPDVVILTRTLPFFRTSDCQVRWRRSEKARIGGADSL